MAASVDSSALRIARRKEGLTQHEVARALGLAGGEAVSVWERGLFEPQTATLLHQLAAVLHVSTADLLRRHAGASDLRYLRLVAGLESADVAALLHVAVSTYRRWERGDWTRALGDDVVASLARAFAVSPMIVSSALAHTKSVTGRDTSS